MSSTLFDMTMDLDSCDWLLSPFGDQSWSGEDIGSLACDIEEKVVQDWSSAKNWYRESSIATLHNPLSPQLDQAFEEPVESVERTNVEGGQLSKERRQSGDELALKSVVSPRELLYCQSTLGTCDQFGQVVVEDPLDVLGSELFSSSDIQCRIRDPHFDDDTTFVPHSDCLIEDHLSCQSDHQIIQSFDSLQSFYVVSANQSEVSVMQQVPSSPAFLPVLDDNCVYDEESLTDPDTVCSLLQRLSSKSAIDSLSIQSGGYKLTSEPVLSPMSSDDVDSVLSIKDEVTSSLCVIDTELLVSDADLLVITEDYTRSELMSKSLRDSSYRKTSSHLPVCVSETNIPTESRKLKKKEQNKSAAHRYRQKKREEKGVVLSEVDQLQLKNNELKTRVEELNREIKYLKGLLDEIRSQ